MALVSELARKVELIKRSLCNVDASNYTSTVCQMLALVRQICELNGDQLNCHQMSTLPEESLVILNLILKSKTHPHLRTTAENLDQLVATLSTATRLSGEETVLLLKCSANCIKKLDSTTINEKQDSHLLSKVTEVMMDTIRTRIESSNTRDEKSNFDLFRTLLASTQVLKSLIGRLKLQSTVTHDIGPLLTILRLLLFVGLPGYELAKQSLSPLFASPLNLHILQEGDSQSSSNGLPKKAGRRRTKSKGRGNGDHDEPLLEHRSDPSDSEMSSTEYDLKNVVDMRGAIRELAVKTRLNSYQLLELIVKTTDKKLMFSYWSSFIPDGSSHSGHSVLTSVVKDPSNKVRSAALIFLCELISAGRQFVYSLSDSRGSKATAAFTPLSVTLAAMVTEIHRTFHGFLFIEMDSDVLFQGLKCLSALVAATPYSKLERGQMVLLIKKTSQLFSSQRDTHVLTAILSTFVVMFESDSAKSETVEFLNSEDGSKIKRRLEIFAVEQVTQAKNLNMCVESIKLLSSLLKLRLENSKDLVKDSLELSISLCNNGLAISNPVLQTQACKLVHGLASCLKLSSSDETTADEQVSWWTRLIGSSLFEAAFGQSDASLLDTSVSTLLDTLSLIRPDIFEHLPKQRSCHLMVLVFSMCKTGIEHASDGSALAVSASAIRCLGIFGAFEANADDWTFLNDVARTCQSVFKTLGDGQFESSKSSQLLMYQSSWAAASVTEVVQKSLASSEEEFGFELNSLLDFSEDVLRAFQFCGAGVQGDNVKTNMVRAAANLSLVLISKRFSEVSQESEGRRRDQVISSVARKVLECLSKGKSFKLQWNCCYALTQLIPQERFVDIASAGGVDLDVILRTVKTTLSSTKNHKVMSCCVETVASANYRLDRVQKQEAIDELCDFFIRKFHSVPQLLLAKWTEKFLSSINKLLIEILDCNLTKCCELRGFMEENQIFANEMFHSQCLLTFDELINKNSTN